MTKHVRRVHDNNYNEKYMCPYLECDFEYKRGEQLKKHIDIHHSNISGYLCHCGFINKDIFVFRNHIRNIHNYSLPRLVIYHT